MPDIDDVLEPLDTLTGLLGALSCIGTDSVGFNPEDFAYTFMHLHSLSRDAQEKLVALSDAIDMKMEDVQEEPATKTTPKKKGA